MVFFLIKIKFSIIVTIFLFIQTISTLFDLTVMVFVTIGDGGASEDALLDDVFLEDFIFEEDVDEDAAADESDSDIDPKGLNATIPTNTSAASNARYNVCLAMKYSISRA